MLERKYPDVVVTNPNAISEKDSDELKNAKAALGFGRRSPSQIIPSMKRAGITPFSAESVDRYKSEAAKVIIGKFKAKWMFIGLALSAALPIAIQPWVQLSRDTGHYFLIPPTTVILLFMINCLYQLLKLGTSGHIGWWYASLQEKGELPIPAEFILTAAKLKKADLAGKLFFFGMEILSGIDSKTNPFAAFLFVQDLAVPESERTKYYLELFIGDFHKGVRHVDAIDA